MPIQHRFCPQDQLFWASMNYASQLSVFHYGVVVIELSIFLHIPEKLLAGLRMKCIYDLQEVSDKESSSLKLHKVKRMPIKYQSFTSKKFQTEHSLIKFLNMFQLLLITLFIFSFLAYTIRRYVSSTAISWNLLHKIDHWEAFMNFTMWRTRQVSNAQKGQPIKKP